MIVIDKNKLLCPVCNSKMVPCKSISKADSLFWMKCTSPGCNVYVDTYIPLPHQEAIHKDNHRYTGVFGGYGSGKTQCSLKDDMKHMLTTPLGTTVVGSAVLSQVEQTYEKDFTNDFPEDFISSQNKTKKTYMLINGHTLLIKSFYEEGLLRSLNASRTHIVEASEVDHEIFVQLKSRLRNTVGTTPKRDENGIPIYDSEKQSFVLYADWRKMIIESNPSAGWIRDNFLLKSDRLFLNGSNYTYNVIERDSNISSHVIPTNKNIFLPSTFYEENAAGKPKWWIRRYLEGSFDYAEGMVYPNVVSSLCEVFEIPKTWKRLIGWDYGIRDATAIIFGAIDQRNGILYVFAEIYVHNMNFEEIGKQYKNVYSTYVPNGTLLSPAVMDGRSINKRNDFNLMTIGDMFASIGIYLEPAKMDLNARMLKVNTMLEKGTLKIMDSCPNLKKEILNYKFPERTADGKTKPGGEKPVDKNNHAINAMEFMIMEAPDNLKNIENKAYDDKGNELSIDAKVYFNKQNTNEYRYNPYADSPKKNRHYSNDMDSIFLGTGGSDDIPW